MLDVTDKELQVLTDIMNNFMLQLQDDRSLLRVLRDKEPDTLKVLKTLYSKVAKLYITSTKYDRRR